LNLVGNLEDLPLSDILQIVHLARQTGTLEISHEGDMINLHFRQGKVVDASAPGSLGRAFQLLQRRGLIDEDEGLRLLHEQPHAETGWADRVLAAGLVSAPLLDQAREEWIRAEIAGLLELKSGEFIFRLLGESPPRTPSTVPGEGIAPQSVTGQTLQFEFDKASPAESEASAAGASELPLMAAVVVQPAPAGGDAKKFITDAAEIPSTKITTDAAGLSAGKGAIPRGAFDETARQDNDRVKISTDSAALSGPDSPLALTGFQIGLALADLVIAESVHRLLSAAGARVQRLPPEQIREWLNHAASPGVLVVDALLPGGGAQILGGIEIARMAQNLRPAIPVITLVPGTASSLGAAAQKAGLQHLMKRPDTAAIPLDQLEARLNHFSRALGRMIMELHPRDEMSDMAAALGAEPAGAVEVTDPMTMLRALIGELRTHGESEVSLLVLRLAAEYFERAVLLLVAGDEIMGMGGFGATGLSEPMAVLVRRIRNALADLPALAAILNAPGGHRGAISAELQPLIAAMGTLAPTEGVFLPLTSRGKVFAVLYGDNAVSGQPIGDLLGLEIFTAQAGIAMENAMLEKQIAEMKTKGL
jgi:hypothetical protein